MIVGPNNGSHKTRSIGSNRTLINGKSFHIHALAIGYENFGVILYTQVSRLLRHDRREPGSLLTFYCLYIMCPGAFLLLSRTHRGHYSSRYNMCSESPIIVHRLVITNRLFGDLATRLGC